MSEAQGMIKNGKNSNGGDDCVNSRRRELERARSLTGEQLFKLLQIISPSLENGASDKRCSKLLDNLGTLLTSSVKTLTPANQTTLELQLGDKTKGIGRFSGRSALLEALHDVQKGQSRSRSKEQPQQPKRDVGAP